MKIANLIKKLTVGAALSFASFQGYCTWYVANGSAAIIDGVTQARNDAVNDAIRKRLPYPQGAGRRRTAINE